MTLEARLQAALQRKQLGPAGSVGIGAYQSGTFNFGDELYGAATALIPGGQNYEQGRDYIRGLYDRAQPGYRLAGEVAGALAVPAAGAAGFVARGAGAAARAGRAATVGAGQGAIAGAGAGESAADRAVGAAGGAAIGGVLGGSLEATLGRVLARKVQLRPEQEVAEGSREAVARGIEQTRGQYTQNPEQLAIENELRGVRGAGGDVIRQFDERQAQQVQAELLRTGERVGGSGDLLPAAGDALTTLQRAERDQHDLVQQAYNQVRGLRGQVTPAGSGDALSDITARFNATINDPVEGIGLNPETGDFLNGVVTKLLRGSGLQEGARVAELEQAVIAAQRRGDNLGAADLQQELAGALAEAEATRPTLQKLEGIRQGLNKNWRSERDPQRKFGLSKMLDDYDDWLESTVASRLFEGDDGIVTQLKAARRESRTYHKLFGVSSKDTEGRAADKLVGVLIDREAGPDQAIRFLTRMQSIGGVGTKTAINRIRKASPEAFQQLRVAHYQNLQVNPRTGQPLTPNEIASNLQRLTERQPDVARAIYGSTGLKDLTGLAKALRATDRQLGATGNASRSALAGANILRRFGRGLGVAVSAATGDPRAIFTAALSEGFGNLESLVSAKRALSLKPPAQTTRRTIRNVGGRATANVGRLGGGGLGLDNESNAEGVSSRGLGQGGASGVAAVGQAGASQETSSATLQKQNSQILAQLQRIGSALEGREGKAPSTRDIDRRLDPEEIALKRRELELREIEAANSLGQQQIEADRQATLLQQQLQMLEALSEMRDIARRRDEESRARRAAGRRGRFLRDENGETIGIDIEGGN